MMTLYGIKTCDTVRKARKWLETAGIAYEYVDLRETAVPPAQLQGWLASAGETLLNKRSTTWKQLDEAERDISSTQDVIDLLARHPTLIKRPVLTSDQRVLIGFSTSEYTAFTQA